MTLAEEVEVAVSFFFTALGGGFAVACSLHFITMVITARVATDFLGRD